MRGKICSAIGMVAFSLGTVCTLSAQQSTKSTNPPAKPAPAPAHPGTPTHPPAGSQPSGGQKRPNAQPNRIIHEFSHGSEHPSGVPVNQPDLHTREPLSASDSALILRDLNAARSHMSAVNRAPLPLGRVTIGERSTHVISTADHRTYEVRPDGSLVGFWHGNTVSMYRSDGTPWLIRTQDMTIMRGVHGEARFESQLSGGTRVVGWGRHEGYVERPLLRGDGHYVQRTYIMNGHQFTAVLHTRNYLGLPLATYVPDSHYGPAFYEWVARNLPPHAHYAWPWLHEEWAAPYRRHFEREYRDSAAWIADYIFAAILQMESGGQSSAAPTEQSGVFFTIKDAPGNAGPSVAADAPPSVASGDPINPELTNNSEDEIRQSQAAEAGEEPMETAITEVSPQTGPQPATQQEASEQSASSKATPQPAPLNLHFHYRYWVDARLPIHTDVLDCTLTQGATLVLPTPPQPGEKTAEVMVEFPNPGDCSRDTRIRVLVDRLVEMSTLRDATSYAGTRALITSLTRSGAPAPPDGSVQPVAAGNPSASLTVDAATVIGQQAQKATATEKGFADNAELEIAQKPPKPR